MILFFEQVSENEGRVTVKHYRPDLLSAEDKEGGVEFSYIPEADIVEGKDAVLYITLDTHELFYKYVDTPIPPAPPEEPPVE